MQDGGAQGRASRLPPRAAAPPSLEPRSISGVWHLLCGSQGAPACAKPREVLLARNPISGAVFQSSGTFLSENTVCGICFILSENFILLAKASWRREVLFSSDSTLVRGRLGRQLRHIRNVRSVINHCKSRIISTNIFCSQRIYLCQLSLINLMSHWLLSLFTQRLPAEIFKQYVSNNKNRLLQSLLF